MATGFLREFFALYKSLPCLWNRRDPKFSDKFQNDLAMMELTKMYRELSPDATQVSVRRELISFKACLHKEHKRRKLVVKTGSPVTSQFQYYNDLSFLLENNAAKPKAAKKPKSLKQPNRLEMMNEKNKTPKRSHIDDDDTFMPKRRIVSPAKKPDVKDKYDMMAEKLRSLPMEQFCYIENILANIFKFAEHENQEWMKTSTTITNRQEAPKPTVANIKTVQSKSVGSQSPREMTLTAGTQATAAPTTSSSPTRSTYPIVIDYQQLTRSSPTATGRQDATTPIGKHKTIAVQTDLGQANVSSRGPPSSRTCSLSAPRVTKDPELFTSIYKDC